MADRIIMPSPEMGDGGFPEVEWHPLEDGPYRVRRCALVAIEDGQIVSIQPPEGLDAKVDFESFDEAFESAMDLHDRWYKAYHCRRLVDQAVKTMRERGHEGDPPEGIFLEAHKTLMSTSDERVYVFIAWRGIKVAELRGYSGLPVWTAGPSVGCCIVY